VTRSPARVLSSYAAVVVLLLLAAAPLLAGRPALAATTRTISLTTNGPKPADLTAAVGDAIQFRNDDPTFVHSVGSEGNNWSFQCRPLAPGEICKVGTLKKPGTYLYKGINLDSFSGRVVVPGATTSAAPSPKASPKPASSPAAHPSPTAQQASPASSPATTGGNGTAGGPPIAGGFGSVGAPSPAPPAPGAPAPNVAPVLPGEQLPSAQPTGPVVVAEPGRLPEPSTARRYGLPAALAAVAAAGVASLLVRLLLAHPAARQARHARSGPAVTVD
jgi:plastocyanin